MRRSMAARSPWLYPAVIGVVTGVLLAALMLRLVDRSPRELVSIPTAAGGGTQTAPGASAAATGSATGGGAGAPAGAANPGPTGESSAPAGSAGSVGPAGPAGGGASARAATGPGALTASDVGVTATTIKVGIVLLDLGGASAFGAAVPGFDPKVQQHEWQTYIDDLNKRGGVNGRKLQAVYVKADPVDTNSQRQACLQLTQDDKVFLVINGASALGTSELCVTAENHTLDFSGQLDPTEYYQRSGGLLITQQQHGNRWFTDWARALDHIGKLRGRHLGILTDQDRADVMVNGGLVPSLRQLGYSVTYLADVSGDPERGPSEIPAQLQQMRVKGVDAVFLATSFVNATAFANDADKQQWRPQYFTSDWSGDDVGTLLGGMPPSFDGAIATTDYAYSPSPAHPEPAWAKECRQRWNTLTGAAITPANGQDYANIVAVCLTMRLVDTATTTAGRFLTRAGVSGAVQDLGPFNWGGLGGHFGPRRTDWAQNMRPMTWGNPQGSTATGNCNPNASKCWNDDGPSFDPE
ncbi:MAG: ABC transporter substrate-binding protein [Acidimicrobiales bacterium]